MDFKPCRAPLTSVVQAGNVAPDLTSTIVVAPPPPPPPPPPLPTWAAPQWASQFPLTSTIVKYWLAALTWSTYSPTANYFTQLARAVVPNSYPISFTPNNDQITPGHGTIRLPHGGIVCVSGTTNLAQWMEQIFTASLVATTYTGQGDLAKGRVLSTYLTAALNISAALVNEVGPGPVILCGHSMGGAVAEVIQNAYRYSQAGLRTHCQTFGSPKPGDVNFSLDMPEDPEQLNRIATPTDFVPSLPPDTRSISLVIPPALQQQAAYWSSFRQPGQLFQVDPEGNLTESQEFNSILLLVQYVTAAAIGQPVTIVTSHQMRTYTQYLRAGFANFNEPVTRGWRAPDAIDAIVDSMRAANLPG